VVEVFIPGKNGKSLFAKDMDKLAAVSY